MDEDRRRKLDAQLAVSAVSILLIATVVYHSLEDWSWVDSFYFSAVAVSTVGFGDIAPDTDAAKLFTVLYIFMGITIITTWLNERLRRRGLKLAHRNQRQPPDADPD